MHNPEHNKIILFDGVCNLCNTSVDFIVRHDQHHQFKFASLQGEIGKRILKQFGLKEDYLDNFVLYQEGKLYHQSTGAIMVISQLGGIWALVKVFYLVPRFIRDFAYKLFARSRYRLFGKRSTCRVPSEAEKSWFLD